jgi:hypothetical protein
MILTKLSPISHKEHSMELPISEERLRAYRESDIPINRFFPELTADQREFIMTGITPEEWEKLFAEDNQ